MRYQVEKVSLTGHGCCFAATVIDTSKDQSNANGWICECFDVSSAHKIAEALNAHDNAPLEENDV